MRRCLELARRARETGDTPVGALIVCADDIVAEGVEAVRAREDVTAHAEIEALRAATARLGTLDLGGCILYTSVEPCVMCAYALRLARIAMVVSGARSAGAEGRFDGYAALTAATLVPGRPVPAVIRDVLAAECFAILNDRGQ
jgi:tRNA(adenine34) deaminase